MPENFEAILKEECGLVKDRAIIVGVSGGPDSLCLMEILRRAGYPIIVAHFDHQLREESAKEARMVEAAAAQLMLEASVGSADVRAHAAKESLSIEEAARNLRYRFLFKLAREHNAQAVAVGHTADDQVETILMHFLRGSGLSGLKGMSDRSILKEFDLEIPLVRPLLNLWRKESVAYCEANGLRPHYDPSNDSLEFQRNRIRHLLIPSLETYNPKFREAVVRMSQSLQGDHAVVTEMVATAWQASVLAADATMVALNADLISRHSIGLQRNLVRHAMRSLLPGVDINFAALERAIKVIELVDGSARVDLLSGLSMVREGHTVYIYVVGAQLPVGDWPQLGSADPIAITVPGEAALTDGWKFTAERGRRPAPTMEEAKGNKNKFQVWLDFENLPQSLHIRTLQRGDHFAPLGLDGHSQKLSDFFINEKVPQRARAHWPLLCKGDEIIWVPGYRPAHAYRLMAETRNAVCFSVMRPPERSVD